MQKVQCARIWTAYKLQYFHNQNSMLVSVSANRQINKSFYLPVFRSSLTILHLISCLVFISSQPQTPLLQANLAESGMLRNTVRLCAHFFDYHFTRETLHALFYFHAALEFVRVLQILRTTCTTFAPVEEPVVSRP